MASKTQLQNKDDYTFLIIMAVIIILIIIGALISGDVNTDNNNHCEEAYVNGEYHERCDTGAELNDKYDEEQREFRNQQRAEEDEYWSHKYEDRFDNY